MFVAHPSQINAIPEHGDVNARSTGVAACSGTRGSACLTNESRADCQLSAAKRRRSKPSGAPAPSERLRGEAPNAVRGRGGCSSACGTVTLHFAAILGSLGQRRPPARRGAWRAPGTLSQARAPDARVAVGARARTQRWRKVIATSRGVPQPFHRTHGQQPGLWESPDGRNPTPTPRSCSFLFLK